MHRKQSPWHASWIAHHYSSCWKMFQGIDWFRSSNFTSLLFNFSKFWRWFQDLYKPTTAKLNTTNGSPMTALSMTALHLHIADFKCTHNFVIYNRLQDLEIIFGIDIQKKLSLSYAWDKENNHYIQRDGKSLSYTRNCEQKATIGTVKSSLKILPRHNGVIPIKITDQ